MANCTTPIFDLPNKSVNNINFKINDSIPSGGGGVSLDQTTINQIVSGIQQARSTGATQLQSRDIPMNQIHNNIDEQVQQEYIPSANITQDFIQDEEEEEETESSYFNYEKAKQLLKHNPSELQTSLILSMIYFLLQLPFIKSLLLKYIPSFYFQDGNMNIYGNVFMSILFGVIYYLLTILFLG
jgi:hypothetical protein